MGSLTKSFATDPAKESQGVWIEIAINDDDSIAEMLIRRMGQSNKDFTKKFAKLTKKFRALRGDKTKLETRALREAFIDTCLLDWRNIEDIRAEKEPGSIYMPYSKENADLLFTELTELLDYVVGQAMEIENFQAEANEEQAKNLFPS